MSLLGGPGDRAGQQAIKTLKETLHTSSVAIFLLKMKRIYSLNNILEIPKKIIREKLSANDPYETQSMTAFTDVFEREFPFCDLSQGQIGKSLFLEKGIPFSRNFIV